MDNNRLTRAFYQPMKEAEALQQRLYLLDQIQSQRSRLSENIEVYAVNRVFQDQTSDVEPPAGQKAAASKCSHSQNGEKRT